MMNLRFIALAPPHIDQILAWLREPHVRKFWTESADETEIRTKFLGKAAKNIHGFLIELDGASVGYVQHYEAWNVGPGWWPDAKPGTYGLDILVGNPARLNRGIGTEALRRFIADILSQGRKVKEVIVDPDPANLSSIRMFEKAGFTRVGMVPTPYGDALLLTLFGPGNE
jgi:RimJ/RimL family protein N-acetyltransferase